ncbi:MAG: hypothetical protein AAGD09_09145 [Cyanobacteria bacterium P01_F01_bin.56]
MGLVALVSWRSLTTIAYQRDVTEAVFLGASTPEIIAALPELEASAEILRTKIDTLPESADLEAAIAHYEANQDDFIKLFAYYRNILTTAGKLSRETGRDETERTERTAAILGSLLNKYRVPQLELELTTDSHSQFLDEPVTAFEEQYSAGAARTTYEILMTPTGAGADLNKDGFIADIQEAQQLPCITLQRIEDLWRSTTKRACGWYSPDGPYVYDSDCTKLDEDKSTLYVAIFNRNTQDALNRIRACGILPE